MCWSITPWPWSSALPPPSRKEIEAAILSGAEHVAARGLTADARDGASPEEISVYRQLARVGCRCGCTPITKIRCRRRWPLSAVFGVSGRADATGSAAQSAETQGRFALRGIKLYLDGALGSRGAALMAPYSDRPNNSGLLLIPPEHVQRWRAGRCCMAAVIRSRRMPSAIAPIIWCCRRTKRRVFAPIATCASASSTPRFCSAPIWNGDATRSWGSSRRFSQPCRQRYAMGRATAWGGADWAFLCLSLAALVGGADCRRIGLPRRKADPRIGLHSAIWRTDERRTERRLPAARRA